MLTRKIVPVRSLMTAALIAAAMGLPALPASAHDMPLTDRQIAAGSPHVVVAVVESAEARWNPQHTLIFTDYSLRVEDRLRGEAPARITLSIPGGTLDGKTYGTCISTHFDVGGRYLLFLQDLETPVLVPVTGGWQGAFRESSGSKGTAEFSRLVQGVRELVARVEADPEAADTAWMNTPEDPGLPAKRYNPNPKAAPAASPRKAGAPKEGPTFFVEFPAVAPMVFEPLPPGSPFSPADREMLAYWNLYVHGGLFRVSAEPATDWGYGNGVSELAGFPTSEKMRRELGVGWHSSSVSAAVYLYDWEIGRTIEADIAMNPGRGWTLDEAATTGASFGSNQFLFQGILLMDLAQAWGFRSIYPRDGFAGDQTEYSWDSVTRNWAKGRELTFATLYAADAAAARATYGKRPIRDGLISPYSAPPSQFGPNYTFLDTSVDSVRAGESFDFTRTIKIENPGTKKLAKPRIEVYLVPRRYSMEGAILLKSFKIADTLRSGDVREVELGSAAVPADTPPGTYYFAFILRDPKDEYQANNRAWAHPWVSLRVSR